MVPEFFERLGPVESLTKENAMDLLDSVELRRGESATFQAHFIDGADDSRRAVGDEVGRGILHDLA